MFMTARVSFPVYITNPTAVPDAMIVFAQIVFSTARGSVCWLFYMLMNENSSSSVFLLQNHQHN